MNGPQAPNPTTTAQTQTQFNMVGNKTPWGTLSFGQSGTWPDGTPKYTATTSLSPGQQNLLNTQTQTQQQIGNTAKSVAGDLGGNLVDINQPKYKSYQSGPQLQTSLGSNDFSGDRQRVEDAMFSRLEPRIERDRSGLETRLSNAGVRQGSKAYSNAMGDFGQNVNDARTSAILNAGQEQNRMQQLALNAGNFANAGMQQNFQNANQTNTLNNGIKDARFNNAITANNANINQATALANGSQVQPPNLSNMAPGTDYTGLVNQQFKNDATNYANTWGAAGNIAGTIAKSPFGQAGLGALGGWMFSDRRLKDDISGKVAEGADGIPLKTWRYKGSPMMHLGYIAQDVAKKRPDAVAKTRGGLMAVDYSKLKAA